MEDEGKKQSEGRMDENKEYVCLCNHVTQYNSYIHKFLMQDSQSFQPLQESVIQVDSLDQFQQRINKAQIRSNPYYLNLILLSIVSVPVPRPLFIRSLIKHGVNVNFAEPESMQEEGKTILMIACEKSVCANVCALLQEKRIQTKMRDSEEQNSLFYCIRNKNEEEAIKIGRILLTSDSSLVRGNNRKGFTPLAYAFLRGSLKFAQLLLIHGADPNVKLEPTGSTVLQILISSCNQLSSTVQKQGIIILLSHGADPYIQDDLGENSFDYAQKYLLDLQELQEEGKSNTEPTQLGTQYGMSQFQSHYKISQKGDNIQEIDRVIRDFGGLDLKKQHSNPLLLQYNIKETNQQQNQENQQHQYHQHHQQSQSQSQSQISSQQIVEQQTLSGQIWQHLIHQNQTYQNTWKQLQNFYLQLCQIAQCYELKVEIVGSFATGLWTTYSDIDIIFINQKNEYIDIKKTLASIYQQIDLVNIDNITFYDHFKVPFIQIQLYLPSGVQIVELSIFQRKGSGRKYVKYIRECLNVNPLIRPLFFTVHAILETFSLHLASKQGLKNYAIFLMICMSLEAYPASTVSQALLNFVYFFNHDFQFEYEYDQNRKKYNCKLNIIDPLNPTNNVGGRQTNVQSLIQMFHILNSALHCLPHDQPLQYLLGLHQMFP